jgi:putative membrane protein
MTPSAVGILIGMAKYEERVLDSLEKMVEEFESGTSAELVVVLAHRSESYADVPYKAGGILAFLAIVMLIYLPIDFPAEMLLVDTLLAFALGFAAGRFSADLTRLLTSRKRRTAAVQRAAQAAFVERGVSLTKERSGVLLYLSWLERGLRLIPDVGVTRCVPRAVWNTAAKSLLTSPLEKEFPETLLEGMRPLAAVFAEHMPPGAENPDEISNRPVVI